MFEFFEAVANVFSTVVGFVVGLFKMLFNLVRFIFQAQTFLFQLIAVLPPFLIVFISVTVSLAIFYQILNKGS